MLIITFGRADFGSTEGTHEMRNNHVILLYSVALCKLWLARQTIDNNCYIDMIVELKIEGICLCNGLYY